MGMFDWAFKSDKELGDSEIPNIFPLALQKDVFIASDIFSTYLKILTDVIDRTSGLSKEVEPALWDNCLQSEAPSGLVSLLADAMSCKRELFIVFKASTKVVRIADKEEEKKIRADYQKNGESPTGVFVSFKDYERTDMLRIYSDFEYCVLGSLNKSLNLAKAIQMKISDLRQSVSLSDSGVAREQAKSIARALGRGNDTYMDAKDVIETAQVDTSPAEKAIAFLDSKRAFILGLPLSYIAGEQTQGIGATGQADSRAVERGLRQYYVSIIRPVTAALFKKETSFKSNDFSQIGSSLEVAKTMDLVSEAYISNDSKQEIVARAFDLDPAEEKKKIDAGLKKQAEEAKNNPPPQPDPNQVVIKPVKGKTPNQGDQ
jgi:hypothetical protein